MTPYRRKARLDADRFDNVRVRERFLYEPQDEWDEYDDYRARSLTQYVVIGVCALLLTGSILFGARYLAAYPPQSHYADNSIEPSMSAAMPPPSDVANENNCGTGSHCASDRDIAKIAWRYFENNHQPATGLVNAVDGVETTTLWDTGSSLAAFIAAHDFGFVSQHKFDHSVMAVLQTLARIDLVDGIAPNILYDTRTAEMVDYSNEPSENGIGVSAIDLARTSFWLHTLQCMHPKYYNPVKRVLARWDYTSLIRDGQLYGLASEQRDQNRQVPIQQGRFGFEQYAGKIFRALGHEAEVSSDYQNRYRANTEILGVTIAHDSRDPRNTGVNNFIVTDSFVLDAMESGINVDNRELLTNIYLVQKQRWRETGIATALTDGHINQAPHYLYNTIFDAGLSFTTTTDTGVRHKDLRTVSTRAAFALAVLFPDDQYSDVLMSTIESAYDPQAGWFSGVYENGGFNDITTANTNGIILETLLYKKYGALGAQCRSHRSLPSVAAR